MRGGQEHDVRGSGSDGWEEWRLQLVERVPKVQGGWIDFRRQMDWSRLELRWWEPGKRWWEGEN